VRKSASPNAVAFTLLNSVGKAFGFDGAGSANAFSGFDGNSPSLWVGVIFGPKDFRQLLTTNTTGTIYSFREFAVGEVLS
jgi:hypothetical protein